MPVVCCRMVSGLSKEFSLRVRFRGVRGSIPAPGPATTRFGGNTPCVEVRAGGALLILDAGSGLRGLGDEVPAGARIEIFLTHYHWDHIHGLPFFAPLFDPLATVRLHGPAPGGAAIGGAAVAAAALDTQFARVHFPVEREAVVAAVSGRLAEVPWAEDGVEVAALPVPHPGGALAYRVRLLPDGPAIGYVPDCELAAAGTDGSASFAELAAFLAGAELLVHDAMYDEAEVAERRGWGHSTPAEAARLAAAAGARRLRLFHHAPWRDDADVPPLVDAARAAAPELEIEAAAEGEELIIAGRAVPTGRRS
jgi:ribonuclease BN (tRNA processing enzyme)